MTSFWIYCAQNLVIICAVYSLVPIWVAKPIERKSLLIRLLFVAVIATLLAKIGGALYYETRPFVLAHTQPLIPHVPDNGFPSDHTLLAFSSAFFLWPLNRRLAVITVILAFLIGLSRIMCLLHSPLDILASILFALIANIAAFVMERRFFSPRNAPQSVANG